MSKVTCAISGLVYHTDYLTSLVIPHTEGNIHPVFSLPKKSLHSLYVAYSRGKLSNTDSYLLFLALLHSTGKVTWRTPASCNPLAETTTLIVSNNMSQLLSVIEKTDAIVHPHFTQPDYHVTVDSSSLYTISSYIKSWAHNIRSFHSQVATEKEQATLTQVTNKLSTLILGADDVSKYTHVIANWADMASGGFPLHKAELYKQTIRACFNITKMFNTPLELLKEIKDFCESTIEADSLHFHTLSKVIQEGIARHVDYLGGSSLALGYTLLPTSLSTNNPTDKQRIDADALNASELAAIVAAAPKEEPLKADYPKLGEYIKARLAWKMSVTAQEEALSKVVAVAKAEKEVAIADVTDSIAEDDMYTYDSADLDGLTITDNLDASLSEEI